MRVERGLRVRVRGGQNQLIGRRIQNLAWTRRGEGIMKIQHQICCSLPHFVEGVRGDISHRTTYSGVVAFLANRRWTLSFSLLFPPLQLYSIKSIQEVFQTYLIQHLLHQIPPLAQERWSILTPRKHGNERSALFGTSQPQAYVCTYVVSYQITLNIPSGPRGKGTKKAAQVDGSKLVRRGLDSPSIRLPNSWVPEVCKVERPIWNGP